MRTTPKTSLMLTLSAGAAAIGLALAAPAAAQSVSEVTVTGRLGPDGTASTLSRVISYSDLDLTFKADQDVLKSRVSDAAKSLCAQLGESNSSGAPLVQSCEQDARNSASDQLKMAFASAVPKSSAMASPMPAAPAATSYETNVSTMEPAPAPAPATFTSQTVTNGPVADTPENRARYGGPMSRAGRMTDPSGN